MQILRELARLPDNPKTYGYMLRKWGRAACCLEDNFRSSQRFLFNCVSHLRLPRQASFLSTNSRFPSWSLFFSICVELKCSDGGEAMWRSQYKHKTNGFSVDSYTHSVHLYLCFSWTHSTAALHIFNWFKWSKQFWQVKINPQMVMWFDFWFQKGNWITPLIQSLEWDNWCPFSDGRPPLVEWEGRQFIFYLFSKKLEVVYMVLPLFI